MTWRRGWAAATMSAIVLWGLPSAAQTNSPPVIDTASALSVAEGEIFVALLEASDSDTPEGDLEWSIPAGDGGGADAAHFTLSVEGTLSFVEPKNYENADDADSNGTYAVTVQVSDGANETTKALSITLTDVALTLSGPTTVDFEENSVVRVAAYEQSDPIGVTWTLAGTDADGFTLDDGVLRPDGAFDFESPGDDDTDNDYEVTVTVNDGTNTETTTVTVSVTNVNEPGSVSVSSALPQLGTELTAALSDPDGVVGTPQWQWERSAGRTEWETISTATTASYTPVAADSEAHLRVTATYTDATGPSQVARHDLPNPAITHKLRSLAVSSTSERAMYPTFDAEVLHYAAGCGDAVQLTASAADAGARLSVNGVNYPSQNASATLDGLGDAGTIEITLSGANGASTTYTVHCIAEKFPDIAAVKASGASGIIDDLIIALPSFRENDRIHPMIIDNNGVPRFHLSSSWANSSGPVFLHFEVDGSRRYVYPLRDASTDHRFVLLDENFDVLASDITTVSPLQKTDNHDFVILDNGDYLMMSYEPAQRNVSILSEFGLSAGTVRLDGTVSLHDSAIQIRTASGSARFTWNSWDHMELRDCTQHRFLRGYAHVNWLQMVDYEVTGEDITGGKIVATFRGCSAVLIIDAVTGEVLTRVGRSNYDDAEWTRRGLDPAPLRMIGDPYGEFCGQHAAHLLANGNLLLFDNGGPCIVDPATSVGGVVGTGDTVRPNDVASRFSRAVEYELDTANGESVFVRHHSLHNSFTRYAVSSGHVEQLANGDWLISWGSPRFDDDPNTPVPPDESITQVDPDTKVQKFSVTITKPDGPELDADFDGDTEREVAKVRAIPVPPVALSRQRVPLAAEIADSADTAAGFTGVDDAPTVVVAFSRPAVDFAADSPSLSVQGATVSSVSAHTAPGEAAYSYLITLDPTGTDTITLQLLTDQACADGGVCAADGTRLTTGARHSVPLDLPPQITTSTTLEVAEGAAAVVALAASDNDTAAAALVWEIPEGVDGGTDAGHFLLSRSGQLTLSAAKDFEDPDDDDADGTYEVTVQVSDATTTVTADLTVSLTDVDEPAVVTYSAASGVTAYDDELAVNENRASALATFTATDPESKAGLTYAWSVGGHDQGDFSITDAGALSFSGIPDYERPADSGGDNVYEITVSALDSDSLTGSVALTVSVDPVNEPPLITGDAAVSVLEGGSRAVGTYRAADPEDSIAWLPLEGPDRDQFDFTWTSTVASLAFKSAAAPDFESPADSDDDNVYNVTLTATAGGASTTLAVAVSVINDDETGALEFSSPRPQAGSNYTATLSDPDGVTSTAWTWERSSSRSGPWEAVSGSTDGTTTSVYEPGDGDVGRYLRSTADYADGHGPAKTRVSVSANAVRADIPDNTAPSFSDRAPQRSVAENARPGSAAGAPVRAADADTATGDVITYSLSRSTLFVIDSASGQIRVAPGGALDFETAPSHSVTVTASDVSNATDTVTVTISITDVNEPPDAVADSVTVSEDDSVDIDVLANDSDPEDNRGDLTIRVTRGPRSGRAEVKASVIPGERATITYTPHADYHGADAFTYEVRDGAAPALSSTATVSVAVSAVNDAPAFVSATIARSITVGARSGTLVGAPVTAVDPDPGDPLTYRLGGADAGLFRIGARSGQISVDDGTDLNVAAGSTYTVTVEAEDPGGEQATVEVTIAVRALGGTSFGGTIGTIGTRSGGGGGGDLT